MEECGELVVVLLVSADGIQVPIGTVSEKTFERFEPLPPGKAKIYSRSLVSGSVDKFDVQGIEFETKHNMHVVDFAKRLVSRGRL